VLLQLVGPRNPAWCIATATSVGKTTTGPRRLHRQASRQALDRLLAITNTDEPAAAQLVRK